MKWLENKNWHRKEVAVNALALEIQNTASKLLILIKSMISYNLNL